MRLPVLRMSVLTGILTWLSFANSASAQYNPHQYTFQQEQVTYTPLTSGTTLGDEQMDEEVFISSGPGSSGIVTGEGFPIGFPFFYGGRYFDHFAVATNGYIGLGNGTFSVSGSVSSAFSSLPFNAADSVYFQYLIGAFHGDLEGQSGSQLRFATLGTAPNRVLVVEWKGFHFWNTTGTESLNFQIHLEEAGNKVRMVYGNFVKNSTDKTVSIGIRTNAFNIVQMRRIQSDSSDTWSNSASSFQNGAYADIKSNFKPASGLSFVYSGPPQQEHDLEVANLWTNARLLFGCQGSATDRLLATVRNSGLSAESSSAYQLIKDGVLAGQGQFVFNPALQPAESRDIEVPVNVDLSAAGAYSFRFSMTTAGDQGIFQLNDTARLSQLLYAPVPNPFPSPLQDLIAFQAGGWKNYYGTSLPVSQGIGFQTGFGFSNPTTAIFISAFSSDTLSEWLVSPAILPRPGMQIKFRAALTLFDSTEAPQTIGDDVFRFLYSTNCGESWNEVYRFNNDSLTAGKISNSKRTYSVPMPAISGPFQLAIKAENKATNNSESYYFHLDDLTMSQGNAYDMALQSINLINGGNPSCNSTTFPVRVKVRNLGDSSVSAVPMELVVDAGTPFVYNANFSPALAKGDTASVLIPNFPLSPNSMGRIVARVKLALEDGFSAQNDTVSQSYMYIGSANPLTLPFSQNFDALPSGVPAGWLNETAQNTDFKIRIRGVNSTRSLSTNLYNTNRTSFAIMPTTQVLPEGYFLRFDLRLKNDFSSPFSLGANDSVVISASTNCGASFQRLRRIDAANPFGYENYAQMQLDLSAMAGQVVSVRFQAYMNRSDLTGAWVDIDNVQITNVSSIESLRNLEGMVLYPNPALDRFKIGLPEGKFQSLRLSGLDGRTIQIWNQYEEEFSLHGIQAGIYLVEVQTPSGIYRSRLVKN